MIQLITRFTVGGRVSDDEFPWVFTESVTFTGPGSSTVGPDRPSVAIGRWHEALRARGVDRLFVEVPSINVPGASPERSRYGFINSVGWRLVGDGPNRERWEVRSELGDRDRPDRRIWNNVATGVRIGPAGRQADKEMGCSEALDEIVVALAAIVDRSHEMAAAQSRSSWVRSELERWVGSFERALRIARTPLGQVSPDAEYQRYLAPSGWSTPEARRLLATAYACQVFGGMGSYNEAPQDPDQSERLFRAMLTGFATALNA